MMRKGKELEFPEWPMGEPGVPPRIYNGYSKKYK
jgi:hypothetical protein